MVVHLDASRAGLDAKSFDTHVLVVHRATRGLKHIVGLYLKSLLSLHKQSCGGLLYGANIFTVFELSALLLHAGYHFIDIFSRICLQGTVSVIDDGHLSAHVNSHRGKLHRNDTATDEHDALGHLFEAEHVAAAADIFLAGNVELVVTLTRAEDNVLSSIFLAIDYNGMGIFQAAVTLNTGAAALLHHGLCHSFVGIDEGNFVLHQFLPVNLRHFVKHAHLEIVLHSGGELEGPVKHDLGVTAVVGTGSKPQVALNSCNFFASLAQNTGSKVTAVTTAHEYSVKIVISHHLVYRVKKGTASIGVFLPEGSVTLLAAL